MKIEVSWFYDISLQEEEIIIGEDLGVALYDESGCTKNVTVWSWTTLNFFGYYFWEKTSEKNITVVWNNVKSYVKVFNFSKGEKLKIKLTWEVHSSSSLLDIDIVSLIAEGGNIDLDGILKISKNIEKIEWYLREKNIFLWDTWSVRWVPTLLVASNDVKASHSCNIEKISDEKLFYMRSRGIPEKESISFFIESYIQQIFICMKNINPMFYEELVEKIQKKVK